MQGLYETEALARLYDAGGRDRPDFAFCRGLAGASVLDPGCGTGAFAVSLHGRARVVGVDPSAAMLRVARGKPGNGRVTWIEGDAGAMRLGAVFDLVVLTGHTFQVFLTEAAQMAVLHSIAAHLAPEGRFVFDTRNPDFPGRKERTPDETRRVVQTDAFGAVEMANASTYNAETGILSYENTYRIMATGVEHHGADQIRYTGQPRLAAMLTEAGLRVDRWMGDWTGRPFVPDAPEIIPLGGLA